MIQNEGEAAVAADKRALRDDGLVAVMATYGLTLPRNAIEWRVAGRRGTLPSLNLSVTLLCTDGIVAWFALGDGTPFFGHLAAFAADAKTKDSVPMVRKPRVLSAKAAKRKALLDSI